MIEIYLPIAGLSVHPGVVAALGALGGILSGLLGIGGGIIITPGLILLGIPAEVAVASHLNQVLATSTSGGLAYWHRRSFDAKLLTWIMIGTFSGAYCGLRLTSTLRDVCQLQNLIHTGYILLLPAIGTAILWDCWQRRQEINLSQPVEPHGWRFWQAWPLTIQLAALDMRISVIPLVLIGIISGFLMAILGAGGGIIMVPAMIYGLGIPNRVAVGTSLLLIAALSGLLTFWYSYGYGSVDLILAALLILGGVIGAQVGVWLAFHTNEYYLRILLAALLLGSTVKLLIQTACLPLNYSKTTALLEYSRPVQMIFELHENHLTLYSVIAVFGALAIGILADQLVHARSQT